MRYEDILDDDPATLCSQCHGSGDVRGFGYDDAPREAMCPACLGYGSARIASLEEIKKAAQHYRVTTTRWFGEETGAAFAALCRALDNYKDTPSDGKE